MSAFFNISSLLLGGVSLILPIACIVNIHKMKKSSIWLYTSISFSACTLGLLLQIFELNHRAIIQDISAILDTIGTLSVVSAVLAGLTIGLNIFVILYRTKK